MNKKIIKIDKKKEIIKKRVCAYCRVSKSTDGLERSLSTQISYFKDLIKSRKDWEFVNIFYDDGISGTSIKKRDGFNKMISEAKSGKIDIILTKSVTRFARNTVDLLNTIRYLKSIGVEVRFEKERINTLDSTGELMLTILAAFAQAEAENLSENVKLGKKMLYEKGIDQAHNLYGYDRKGKNYKINVKEAKVVKYIFKEFNKGAAYEDIAKYLRQKGYKTRKGRPFNYPQVRTILKNEKYAGFTILRKHYTSDPINHKSTYNLGEEKKYKIPNTHPKIIDLDTFEKAQFRMMKLSDILCHKGLRQYKYERMED